MNWSLAHKIVRRRARNCGSSRSVIATDDRGTVIYWNAAAERLYGWPKAEALGQNIVDLTPATVSRRKAEQIMNRLLKGQSWSGDFTVRHRDGSALIVHVDDEPVLHDGGVAGVVGVSWPVRVG